MGPNELIGVVEDTIRLDAYRHYPHTRREIPGLVIPAVAIACLTQFLKGLIDFEKLGKKSRDLLEDVLRRWRGKETLETGEKARSLEKVLAHALELLPPRLSEEKYD